MNLQTSRQFLAKLAAKRRLRIVRVLPLAVALFASESALANTEDDVVNGQSDLTQPATYSGGLPTTTSDVTFTNVAYSPTAFTLNPNGFNLSIGTLDDLDATQTLTIQNTTSTSTITLNGGTNSVSGNAADLLYVANGGTLNIGGGAGALNLALAATGNFNVAGTANINSVISGAFGFTKTGAGTLTLGGTNTYTGPTTVSAGTVAFSANANLGANTAPVSLNGGTLQDTSPTALTDTHVVTVGASGGTLNVTGFQLFLATANTLVGSGPLAITGSGTVTQGQNNVRVGATNTFSGPVTLSGGGILEFGVANALASTAYNVNSNGEFALQGFSAVTLPNTVTVNANGGTLSFENGNLGVYASNIALGTNGASVALRDWYNYAQARSGTINGIISGAAGTGALTINSGTSATGGTLTLNGVNTFAGGVVVNGPSILALGNSAGAGTGTITLNNGSTLNIGTTATVFAGNAVAVGLGATVNFTSGSASNGYGGSITGDATSAVNFPSGTQVSFNNNSSVQQFGNFLGTATIASGASLRFSGSSGVNNGGASTTFNVLGTGNIQTRNTATVHLGALTGTGNLQGASGAAGTITYIIGEKNAASTFDGTIANGNFTSTGAQPVTVQKSGNSSLTLTGTNTYTGGTNIITGSIGIGNNSALGTGVLNFGGTNSTAPTIFAFGAARNVNNSVFLLATSGGGNPTVSGLNDLTILGVVTASGGPRILSVNSSGVTTLSGNVFLSDDNTTGGRGLTINGTGNTTVSGVIANNNAANTLASNLTKSGSSTLTLTNANTYTGATSVTGGTLLVNGSTSTSSAVTVNNSGTLLGGTGTVGGVVTINGPAAITAATSGTVGTLTMSSGLTLAGTSGNLATYLVDIGSGANNSDRLTIGGALNLSGAFDRLTFNGTPDGVNSYVLASYASVSGTFDNVSVPAGYALQYNASELDLVLVPVPEPATVAAGLLALGTLGVSQRRRVRRWLGARRAGAAGLALAA